MTMSNDEFNELVVRVANRINGSQVTRLIPRNVQDELKKWTQGFPYKHQFVMPIGPGGVMVEMQIEPDGSMKLQLFDITHYKFWEAHLEAPED